MAKFILVHDVPTGNPIVVNTEEIRVIRKSEVYTGASAISGTVYENIISDPFVHVTETPEQIFEMIKS